MIKTTVDTNGFEGIFFPVDHRKDKVVIVVSGSNGGMRTLIPIEKIKAPILFLSAVNDTVWPSYESSLYMEKYLKEKSYAHPYKHIAFENLSHAMLTEISFVYRLAFKTERYNKEKCAKERIQLKNELLNWVQNVWK